MVSTVPLHAQRGARIEALSLISYWTFCLCDCAVGFRHLEPTHQRASSRASARELRRQWERFSGFFDHGREAWHDNNAAGPEIDLLSGWHRGGIRDDRLHNCFLHVSKLFPHSRDNFRKPMLDFSSRPSRSWMEVASSGRLKRPGLLHCMGPVLAHNAALNPSCRGLLVGGEADINAAPR